LEGDKSEIIVNFEYVYFNKDGSIGIATGYELDGPGSIPGNARFLSSPQCPDRLWGPPSLLFKGFRGLFPRG
jgi:hypothetical protein